MEIRDDELAEAGRRAEVTRRGGRAVAARFERKGARIIIGLNSGIEVGVPAALIEGLAGAVADELVEVEISPSGLGLHWPRLDVDVYIPALLQGVLGSPSWMAAQLGATGGKVCSTAKTAAARANGRKGGRPRAA